MNTLRLLKCDFIDVNPGATESHGIMSFVKKFKPDEIGE